MPDMIRTLNVPFRRTHATNVTASLPADPSPTITEPSGDGIVNLTSLGSSTPNFGMVLCTGVGTTGQTGAARVFLWHQIGNVWFPTLASSVLMTLGASTGVGSQSVPSTEKFSNVFTPTSDSPSGPVVNSPGTSTAIANLIFDLFGAKKIEVRLGNTNATSFNALFKEW